MTAKLRRKVTATLAVQEHYREVICPKIMHGNRNTANNFFSPNTVDFQMQTSHTVRLEITTIPQAGIFLTATPHKKMCNITTPQIPNIPLTFEKLRLWPNVPTYKVCISICDEH